MGYDPFVTDREHHEQAMGWKFQPGPLADPRNVDSGAGQIGGWLEEGQGRKTRMNKGMGRFLAKKADRVRNDASWK